MVGKSKKYILCAACLLAVLFFSNYASAHSGRTDSSGGHNCNVGSCAGTYHYHNSGSSYKSPAPTYSPPPKPSCPNNSTLKAGECNCNYGYVKSGNSCIKIPNNAHIAPAGNTKDVWLCDDGYREDDNQCILEEKIIEETEQVQEESKEPEVINQNVEGISYEIKENTLDTSEGGSSSGGVVATILAGLGGIGWYAVRKNNKQFK